MRLLSPRPERGASANSATSANLLRVEFYLKDGFCQPDENIHTLFICYLPVRNIIYSESYYYMEQNNMVPRHSDIPIIYEMISKISKYQYC